MTQENVTWRGFGKHDMVVDTNHDEAARLDFTINLFKHVGSEIFPGHRKLYDHKVEPTFEKENGRKPKDRHEVRKAMLGEEYFRLWSMLRLYAQENGYNERRNIVERQLDDLIKRAKPREADKGSVEIDPNFEVPPYQKSLDIHWMPGSYYTETTKDDVSAGAMYDAGGLYLSTYGMLGKYNNGAGYAVATWIKDNYPHINPKRISTRVALWAATLCPTKMPGRTLTLSASILVVRACAMGIAEPRASDLMSPFHSKTLSIQSMRTDRSTWFCRPCSYMKPQTELSITSLPRTIGY